MRLCRFEYDESTLAGFYLDDRVVPIHAAAMEYQEETGVDLPLGADDDLIDFLPPDGGSLAAVRTLSDWVDGLDESDLGAMAIPVDEGRLLVPVREPRKILCLAGNYAAHVIERGGAVAEREETFPYVFMKPPTTLTDPGGPIVIPRVSPDHVDWECELGVVIGRRCRDVDEAEALGYVGGYTIVNDVSDRRFTPNPGRKPRERDKFFDWLHGKWHDSFCPVGPCILAADAGGAELPCSAIGLSVNGEVKQDSTTNQMIFPVAAIVAFISRFVTLEPGDLIATGTPSGVGSATGQYLRPGDLVVATIEGIGTLENPVEAEAGAETGVEAESEA